MVGSTETAAQALPASSRAQSADNATKPSTSDLAKAAGDPIWPHVVMLGRNAWRTLAGGNCSLQPVNNATPPPNAAFASHSSNWSTAWLGAVLHASLLVASSADATCGGPENG